MQGVITFYEKTIQAMWVANTSDAACLHLLPTDGYQQLHYMACFHCPRTSEKNRIRPKTETPNYCLPLKPLTFNPLYSISLIWRYIPQILVFVIDFEIKGKNPHCQHFNKNQKRKKSFFKETSMSAYENFQLPYIYTMHRYAFTNTNTTTCTHSYP